MCYAMRHTAPDLTSGSVWPVVVTLLCFCAPSTQRGQQYYFTNFQQPPSQPQYENYFQPRTPDPYSPYRPSPFQLPVSNVAPQSFSAFQQGGELYRQRAPSFLDQITLTPGGFSRDQRLLQAYPSNLNHPSSTPVAPQAYPSNPPILQDFPSEPDDLGLSTFVDQNLEVDQRPTEDPKSIIRPRQKNRTGDSTLRRKPVTRPQAGSRGNFLSPQKIRSEVTGEILRSVPQEGDTRSQLQYPSTSSPRTRGRFSPSTKAPSKVRQFHIRPSKVPFTPRRPLWPTSPSDDDDDDPRGLEGSDASVEDSAYTSDSSKVSEHPADILEVPIHPADSFKGSDPPSHSSEVSEHPAYSFDISVHPEDSSKAPVHPANSSELYGSEVVHSEGNEQHVAENSTLNLDSNEATTLLQDDQSDRALLVKGHTESTDIDPVMTTLRDEPTTLSEEDKAPEERIHGKENNSNTYEVLTMNPGHTLVEEDNFRGFVDSVLIDTTDSPQVHNISEETATEETLGETTLKTLQSAVESTEEPADVSVATTSTSKPPDASVVTSQASKLLGISLVTTVDSKPLGVSVVTTKSVINGTMFAVPSVAPPILEQMATPVSAKEQPELVHPTESWVVVASVQTSRSVSGARFLPSSAVKQEERPQSLSGKTLPSSKPTQSTESIIDKLYRVESELSSGILTGGLRPEGKKLQLEVLTDMTDTNTSTAAPTPTTTYKSPVFIRKFMPHSNRTTPKPNKPAVLFDSIPMDDLSRLLPPGFKQRSPTSRRTTVPPTTHVETVDYPQGDEPVKPNITSSRSSGLGSARNKIKVEDVSSVGKPPKKLEDLFSRVKFDDIMAFLPPGYNHSAEDSNSTTGKPRDVEGFLSKAKPVDVSSFLPSGFKLPAEEPTSTTSKPRDVEGLLSKAKPLNVSSFLPPGFKPPAGVPTSTAKLKGLESLLSKSQPVDVSGFLPPGFKLPVKEPTSTTSKPGDVEALLKKAQPVDVSAFLPPGFKLATTTQKSDPQLVSDIGTLLPSGIIEENSTIKVTTPADMFRVKFPTRTGVTRKPLAQTHKPVQGPGVPKPKISSGWPTRATTEFTGWPTPSTTPIPLEKLLEMAKTQTTTSSSSTTTTTSTTTSTTTTTTTTPRPTTPGVCTEDCDVAGTVKLVGGVMWVPELLDHNTEEWQDLASEVQGQLETTYRRSDSLGKWFRKIRIDSFSDGASVNVADAGKGVGSVLVDYFVELTDVGRRVDTQDMKRLFHNSLSEDPDVVSSRLQLGRFLVDPKSTDFIVLAKQVVPTVGYADEDVFLPQWAIAGIVIGLASLLFVIIFGVSVLVNRNKNNKKKSPTPLTEDMLNELNKNHMGGLDNCGADDLYNMDDVWNDKPPKKRLSGSLQENSMSNLYDSWRSEWNGYYYNAYYGNGNAGSSTSGYSRRRSDYDTNF